jgi:hypothetical protein
LARKYDKICLLWAQAFILELDFGQATIAVGKLPNALDELSLMNDNNIIIIAAISCNYYLAK